MGSREAALKAKTELELAKIRLARRAGEPEEKTIRAPLSGIVVKKHKEAGRGRRSRREAHRYREHRPGLRAVLRQPEAAPGLSGRPGGRTSASTSRSTRSSPGKIDFIAPNIEATHPVSLRVKVLIDNPDHVIKAGMKGWRASEDALRCRR